MEPKNEPAPIIDGTTINIKAVNFGLSMYNETAHPTVWKKRLIVNSVDNWVCRFHQDEAVVGVVGCEEGILQIRRLSFRFP